MPVSLGFPLGALFAFLLVLARVGGFIAFLPVPGFRNAPRSIRAGLALAVAVLLFPVWPALPGPLSSIGQLAFWALSETGFGLAAGLAVSFLTEGFQIAAQVAGLQAGYGYASVIDPNSEADSSVLQVFMSLFTSLLFFSLGLDHQLIRALAASFEKFPAGSWAPAAASLDGIVRLGGEMFSLGWRLALPVAALLALIDIALGLAGRIQQQLQLVSLAFPAKMAIALALFAVLMPVVLRLFGVESERTLAELWRALGA